MRAAVMFRMLVLTLALAGQAAVAEAQLLWCDGADAITAEVSQDTLTVFHRAAKYNCCPDSIHYDVSVDADSIVVYEREMLSFPCTCDCCFTLKVEIDSLRTGDYRLDFHWFDLEYWQWKVVSLPVQIRSAIPPGHVSVAATERSACQLFGAVGEPERKETGSWSSIKVLFR